ncbi:MAG: putative rane protein [Herbinix sp.]|nr:putative rane protein [Herbinix sp.]
MLESIKHYFKRYDYKKFNITLMVVVVIISLIGAFLVKQVELEGENLFLKQLVGLVGGIFLALIVAIIDYHFICSFYIVLYIINMILLVYVKLFGVNINEAQRWIQIGPIQFQPSELTKIILILFIAMYFTHLRARVILFIFATMVFVAGISWKIILPIVVIGVPVVFGLFWYIQQDYQVLLNPYQRNRILSMINPEEYPAIMYQQDLSKMAIGTGQLTGKIFADGEAGKRVYDKIPISESCCIIIALYAVIIYICLTTARKAPDYLGMLIAIGLASMFAFQVFVNVGVVTALLPNTGIPLPFLSSGLSSMISGMIAVGLILNIRMQPQKTRSYHK